MKSNDTHDPCCDDPCCDRCCDTGSRNRYFVGKRLTPASFSAEQDYHVQRRRLLNRSMHGWGVVWGLAVTPTNANASGNGTLLIGPGLALDRAGRELVVTQALTLRHADVKVLASAATTKATSWLLSAHYAERRILPVTLKDECHCERNEWDQTCEEVFFTLREIDTTDCCASHPCELCCCEGEGCVEESNASGEAGCDGCTGDCEDPLSPRNRSPHRCLCTHLTGLAIGAQIETLCKINVCLDADLHNAVALACVSLKIDECGDMVFDRVLDACGPRRLVKRNDLLFDLIRGCDLTVIDGTSWAEWHRRVEPVDFVDFSTKFSAADAPPDRCVTNFSVHFSRPVRVDSLRADCFSFAVIDPQEKTGWGELLRVPIVGVQASELSGDANEFARRATLVVDGQWFGDELRRGSRNWSLFRDDVTQIEIEVRGDYIIDCNGQSVDANPMGVRAVPSGNGTPGGTYVSTFSVEPNADENPKHKPTPIQTI